MKLDNRPRKLLVKGVPEESVEIARNWYGVRILSLPLRQTSLLKRGSVDNERRRQRRTVGGRRPHCFFQNKKLRGTGMSDLA